MKLIFAITLFILTAQEPDVITYTGKNFAQVKAFYPHVREVKGKIMTLKVKPLNSKDSVVARQGFYIFKNGMVKDPSDLR